MVCLKRSYHFKFFKGCLPQILLVHSQILRPIHHSRKSLLFGKENTWIKKGMDLFVVAMGNYANAEVYKLVTILFEKTLAKSVVIVKFNYTWMTV